MSNPSRQKGTAFEVELLNDLLRIWPTADRAPLKGINDKGDFVGVNDWMIEAKKRERWDIRAWVRTLLKKRKQHDPTAPWMIVFAEDRRKGTPTLVVLEWDQYKEQLALLRRQHGN